MHPFPYFEIVKKAYELTVKNPWLWIFGLFIGGTTGFNLGSFNYVLPPPAINDYFAVKESYEAASSWVTAHPQEFAWLVALILLVGFVLLILSGLSRAAVIWATAKMTAAEKEPEPSGFKKTLREAQRFLWPIVGLQICITAGFLLIFLLFLAPIVYLFAVNAIGRAIVLLFLALVILLPTSIVFIFLHRYGPIFIVLFSQRISQALQLSFSLLRQKIRESLILAAFLVGLSFLFLLGLTFALILFSLPISLLGLLLVKLELGLAFYTLLVGSVITGIVFTIVLSAGFAVYQNIAWVLAVQELVKTVKKPAEKAKEAFAPEPAA